MCIKKGNWVPFQITKERIRPLLKISSKTCFEKKTHDKGMEAEQKGEIPYRAQKKTSRSRMAQKPRVGGRAATECFSAQLPRAHRSGPE